MHQPGYDGDEKLRFLGSSPTHLHQLLGLADRGQNQALCGAKRRELSTGSSLVEWGRGLRSSWLEMCFDEFFHRQAGSSH